jgi:hypothetical protein
VIGPVVAPHAAVSFWDFANQIAKRGIVHANAQKAKPEKEKGLARPTASNTPEMMRISKWQAW